MHCRKVRPHKKSEVDQNDTLTSQDSTDTSASSRATRSTRSTRSTRANAGSSQASHSTTRSTRAKKGTSDDVEPTTKEPVFSMAHTAIAETEEEDAVETEAFVHVQANSNSTSIVVVDTCKSEADEQPHTKRRKSTFDSPHVTLSVTPKIGTLQSKKAQKSTPQHMLVSPPTVAKSSPQNTPGYRFMSVKDKAQVFEGHARSSQTRSSSDEAETHKVVDSVKAKQMWDTPPETPEESGKENNAPSSEIEEVHMEQNTSRSSTTLSRNRSSVHRVSTKLSLSQRRSSLNRHKLRTSVRMSQVKNKQAKQMLNQSIRESPTKSQVSMILLEIPIILGDI